MEQVIKQMAAALKSVSGLQDVAGFGFQLIDEAKKQHGVTPEQSADLEKKAAELNNKLTELNHVGNSYK